MTNSNSVLLTRPKCPNFLQLITNSGVRLTLLMIASLGISMSTFAADGGPDEARDLLFVQPETAETRALPLAPEIELVLPAGKEAVGVHNEETKQALIETLRRSIGTETKDARGVLIPLGPESLEELSVFEKASSVEIESFLSKKAAFLAKFAKITGTFRLKPALVSKALKEINAKFYSSANLIMKSNAYSGTTMFSLSTGLALPERIMEAMRGSRMGRFVPEKSGFFYMIGLGAGLSSVPSKKSDRRVMQLEIFLDLESLKKSISGILEISIAGNYGVVFEHRDGHFASQRGVTTYGGVAGVFREGPHQFGWAASTGLSIPPGIGAFLVYQDHAYRHYLLRVNREGISVPALQGSKDKLVEFFMKVIGRKPAARSCRDLFN